MVESLPTSFETKMVGKVSLAPMVRMNTLPFRQLALRYGADFVYSEEIIDKKYLTCVRVENDLLGTIDYVNAREYALVLRIRRDEREKFILQIGTNSAETAVKAVEKLLPDIGGVDVNMGCPKKFSVQGGMGSALMKNIENAASIMRALVTNFGGKISVSCKIRVLKSFEETLKYVLAMQETGIHWIAIHPRTAQEESVVPAKWYIVKRIVDSGLIKIPILGSGDLFSPLDVHKYISFTKANGVILARGAIHNPAIFALKSLMLNIESPIIPIKPMLEGAPETQTVDQDWKDNTTEPLSTASSSTIDEPQPEAKSKKGKQDDEEIKFSQNLVKVYDRRYSRMPMHIDILDIVKEYFKLCIESGNHYQNTKYCIMYMLKTHKPHFELFKQIHQAKTLREQAIALKVEHLFEGLSDAHMQHFEGQYYRKNKGVIDILAQKEHLIQKVEQPTATIVLGSKRAPEEVPPLTCANEQLSEEGQQAQAAKRLKLE